MVNIHSLMERKLQIEQEIEVYQKIVSSKPEGRLISRKTGEHNYRYSFSNPKIKKEHYIAEKEKHIAEELALGEYASCRLKDLRKEKRLLEGHIRFAQRESNADRYLRNHPGASALVLPSLRTQEAYLKSWAEADYIRSNDHPENLKFSTVFPELKVRSKAESDWISRLTYFGVPLRYEELITIDNIAYHPDITCLNIVTLKKFYIEHQGGWDQERYVDRLHAREQDYRKMGIIPWQNLLITTETKDSPLDINWVDQLIRYFLLQ